MDKQISSKKVWSILFKVYQELDSFDIDFLSNLPLDKYKDLFNNKKYHLHYNYNKYNFLHLDL